MVRHRLFDVELVVSRTIAHAVLAGLGLGTYVVLVGVVGAAPDGTRSGPFIAATVTFEQLSPPPVRMGRRTVRRV